MSTNEESSLQTAAEQNLPPTPHDTASATTTTATTSTNSNKGAKKRKQHWRQRREQKKKERVEKQKEGGVVLNRRGPDQDWESQTPHEGSFAHQNARNLFNVQLQPNPSQDDNDEETVVKLPKRKVAVLLAYTGTNYGGLQMNVGERSIHAELELAFYKARLLSKTNFGFPHKYSWSSSARTDKGVHACAQVISAKLTVPSDNVDAARELVNRYLPNDICVLDIVKTTRSFCAKTQRDRARYTYMIPSFLLYNRHELQALFTSVLGRDLRHGRTAKDPLSREETNKLAVVLTRYRVTPQQLKVLKGALVQYQGTLSFHNFTSHKTSDDANATRYIISFTAQDPIMMEGVEWIPTQVVGQSFLLHQIRKMISLAIDVARGTASMDTLQRALSSSETFQLNKAPAQGLFLDMSIFEGYNRRKAKTAQLQDLDWVSDESMPAVQRWKDFRENVIMKHIGTEEAAQGNFVKYLYVQEYVYDYKKKYKVDGQ